MYSVQGNKRWIAVGTDAGTDEGTDEGTDAGTLKLAANLAIQ